MAVLNITCAPVLGYQMDILRSTYVRSPDNGLDDEINVRKREARNLSEKKRRDQFNQLVTELYSILPSSTRRMDKSAVLENAIAFLKTNQLRSDAEVGDVLGEWKPDFVSNDNFDQLVLDAIDGFVIAFEKKGTIKYLSENVIHALLYSQDELIKLNIYDYIHHDDHAKVMHAFLSNGDELILADGKDVTINCRMRHGSSRNDNKPRYVDVEVSGYVGHYTPPQLADLDQIEDFQFYGTISVKDLCLPRVLGYKSMMEQEFVMRHSMDWKLLEVDARGQPMLGYQTFEIVGTSTYDYIHNEDLKRLAKAHEKVVTEGEGETAAYRFRTKGRQWIWLVSRFHISYNQWDSKAVYIVSTNRVVSPVSALKSCVVESVGERTGDAFEGAEDTAISSTSCSRRKRPSNTQDAVETSSTVGQLKRPRSTSPQIVCSTIELKPKIEDIWASNTLTPCKRMTIHDDSYYATTTLGNICNAIQQITPMIQDVGHQPFSNPNMDSKSNQNASPGRFSGFSSQRAPRVHVNLVQAELWDELQAKYAKLREAFGKQQQHLRQIATVMQTVHQNMGCTIKQEYNGGQMSVCSQDNEQTQPMTPTSQHPQTPIQAMYPQCATNNPSQQHHCVSDSGQAYGGQQTSHQFDTRQQHQHQHQHQQHSQQQQQRQQRQPHHQYSSTTVPYPRLHSLRQEHHMASRDEHAGNQLGALSQDESWGMEPSSNRYIPPRPATDPPC